MANPERGFLNGSSKIQRSRFHQRPLLPQTTLPSAVKLHLEYGPKDSPSVSDLLIPLMAQGKDDKKAGADTTAGGAGDADDDDDFFDDDDDD